MKITMWRRPIVRGGCAALAAAGVISGVVAMVPQFTATSAAPHVYQAPTATPVKLADAQDPQAGIYTFDHETTVNIWALAHSGATIANLCRLAQAPGYICDVIDGVSGPIDSLGEPGPTDCLNVALFSRFPFFSFQYLTCTPDQMPPDDEAQFAQT